jgi:DNA polymerase I-like protein with 3'-5' exonuclease and polymerase domains
MSLLEVAVFDEIVIAWNFKNLATYARHHMKRIGKFDFKLLDLKLIEAFCGKRGEKSPESFQDAQRRMVEAATNTSWKRVHEGIHLPLAKRVVPALECEGIIDTIGRRTVYASYEIDWTVTGRMACRLMTRGYSPHADCNSARYKPRGEEEVVVYFDYRAMEVGMIQWLSGDEELKSLLNSGQDVYEGSWYKLTNLTNMPKDWKLSFLAYFFGMGAEAMSARHGWSLEVSKEMMSRMSKVFSSASSYLREVRKQAGNEVVKDFFGRPRDCRNEPHKAQNFVIQSPASIVCLEKMIQLHDNCPAFSRPAFHVHDGCALICDVKVVREVCRQALAILESESAFCPGIRLKASAKVGKHFGNKILIPEEWRV